MLKLMELNWILRTVVSQKICGKTLCAHN